MTPFNIGRSGGSDASPLKAHRKAGKAGVCRATKRSYPRRRCGERSTTTVFRHIDGPQDSVPEAIAQNAARVYRSFGVRYKFQMPSHHKTRLQGRRGYLLSTISASWIRRNRVLCDSVNRPSQGRWLIYLPHGIQELMSDHPIRGTVECSWTTSKHTSARHTRK